MSRHTHFHYVSTKCGESWHAWKAGDAVWFQCHQKGRTKPCLNAVTNGVLACPYCTDPNNRVALTGYLPLFREVDARPVFVVLHDYLFERIEDLKHLERVVVARGRVQSDGVSVCRAPVQSPRYHSTLPERMRPMDLIPALICIWNIPELAAWYLHTQGVNVFELPNYPPTTQAPAELVTAAPPESWDDRAERNRRFIEEQKAKVAGAVSVNTDRPAGAQHEGNGKAKKKPQ